MTESASASSQGDLLTGVFAGPVSGLRYQTPTTAGLTSERGEFRYRDGEAVTFRIGRFVLGAAAAAPRLNLAALVPRVAGDIAKLHDAGATNLARLVQTLDEDGDPENGIAIAPAVHEIMDSRVIDFDQTFSPGAPETSFAADPEVVGLLDALNGAEDVFSARTPRTLRAAPSARNELRRNIRGILKTTDVRVPLRDGSFTYADVFRPADDGRYPVIMNMGFYGKAFHQDGICDEADALEKEDLEDRFFSGNPDSVQYENHESVNTSEWVPHGYVVMRVDARGVGKSPGEQAPLGRQEAEDYYDAIEWAAQQPWCNGNIGLWGMSYYAMSQHNVASLRPPHLKAMIALGTDSDSYNDYLYGGGLLSEGFWTWWGKILTKDNACGERRETDWMAGLKAHPFNDPVVYGPDAATFMTPEITKVTTPVWILGPQTGAVLHQSGSSETFVNLSSAQFRKFDFVDAWFPHCYRPSTVAEHMRFFDHWLKGIDSGITDEPRVRVQVRTGNAAYYELHDSDWPLPQTEYTKFHLDATASSWDGDEHGREVFCLSRAPARDERSAAYDADLELGQPTLAPTRWIGGTPRWATGISFVSDPLEQDVVLVGYMKAHLWVSSTSSDMDVHVSVRVIDEDDREIRYEAAVLPMDPHHIFPVGFGSLKVSHRALDAARTTDRGPVHSHTEAEHAPLRSDEVVEIELGLNPSSALVRKGCRLHVDVQPISPAGVPARSYDESYHRGATNTIYTGPDHPSWIQLPLLPGQPGEPSARSA